MIVLDTTVLVYAVGDEHTLRDPARAIVEAVVDGTIQATTTIEAIQKFVHVRARRRDRADAGALGRAYSTLLSPLLQPSEDDLEKGLRLFEREDRLGPFDAGSRSIPLDMRDAHGRALPSGIYFAGVRTKCGSKTVAIPILR